MYLTRISPGYPSPPPPNTRCIRPDNAIEHRDVHGNILVQQDALALDRPVRIGVTSGASTPDSVVQVPRSPNPNPTPTPTLGRLHACLGRDRGVAC